MLDVKTLPLITVVSLLPIAGMAATVQIDSFDTSQSVIDPLGGMFGSTSTVTATEALGGMRTITARGDGTLFPVSTTTINISGGTAAVSNSDQVTGTGLFEWAAGGVDFTDGGTNDTFVLDIVSIDLGATFALTVDGATATSAYSTTTGFVSFDFGAFGDLTSASTISLMVSGDVSLDTSFWFLGAEDLVADPGNQTVSPVPLPAGGLLLGGILMAGGVAASRKRRT